MPTVEESVCCHEIDRVGEMKWDYSCIIGHPGFEGGCLNKYALQFTYYAYRQHHGPREGSENAKYRYIGSRQLAR